MMSLLCIPNCLLPVKAGQLSARDRTGSTASIKRLISETDGAGVGSHVYANGSADKPSCNSCTGASDICDRLHQEDRELDGLRALAEAAPGMFSGRLAAAASSFCGKIKSATTLLQNHIRIRIKDLSGIIQGEECDSNAPLIAGINEECSCIGDMRRALCEALNVRKAWLVANKDSFADCNDGEIEQMCQFSYVPGDITAPRYNTYNIAKALSNDSSELWDVYCKAGTANRVDAGGSYKQHVAVRTSGKDARLSDIFMLLATAIYREMLGGKGPWGKEKVAESLLSAFHMPEYVQWLRDWDESSRNAGSFYRNLILTPEEHATITEMAQRNDSTIYESSQALLAAKMLFGHAIFRFCCLRQPVDERAEAQQNDRAYWKGVRGCIDGLYYAIFTSSYAISSDNLNAMANFFSMLSNIRLDILLITKGMRGNSSAITDRASGGVEARICKNAVWYFVRRAERNTPQNYEDYTVLRTMPISQLENASDSPAASQRRHSLYLWCMNIIRAWTMSEAEASFFGKDSNHRVNEPHFTLWWKNGQWCCTTAAAISAHRRPKK